MIDRKELQAQIDEAVRGLADELTLGLPDGIGFALMLYETDVPAPCVQVAASASPEQIARLFADASASFTEKAKTGDFEVVTVDKQGSNNEEGEEAN